MPARKGSKARPGEVPKGPKRNNIDPAIVRRRQATVNRLRADGYSLREISDALVSMHTNGDSPLFTFIGPDRQPLTPEALARLTYEELRDRAYEVVKQDVKKHRIEAGTEQPDALRLADDRYLLAERLRVYLKRLILRMEGDRTANPPIFGEADNGKYNQMLRTAIELATRIGRLQGIETEKPIELRLPERYRAWIDEEGIIHKEKLAPSESEQNDDEPTN
jgi:hypothetical protein